MDPHACLSDIFTYWALATKGKEDYFYGVECMEACNNLIRWIESGGFTSLDSRDLLGFARVMRHHAKALMDRTEND